MSDARIREILISILKQYAIQFSMLTVIVCGLWVWNVKHDAENEIDEQRRDILYIKDGYDTSTVISIKDVRRKVSALTIEIVSTYGFKPNFGKAFNKVQLDEVNRLNIKYAELLDYGYYDLIAIGLMESSFNPNAEGQLLDDVYDLDLNYNEGMKEYFKKIKAINQDTDDRYKKVFKNIHEGTWTKGMRLGKYMIKNADNLFLDYRNKVYKEDQWQFWTIFGIMIVCAVSLLAILIVVFYFLIAKYIIKREQLKLMKIKQGAK